MIVTDFFHQIRQLWATPQTYTTPSNNKLLLTAITASLTLAVMFIFTAIMLFSTQAERDIFLPLVVLPINLLTFWFIRRGQTELATRLFLGLLWGVVTIANFVYPIPGPPLYTYIVVIIMTGVLVGLRAMLGITFLSTLALAFIWFFMPHATLRDSFGWWIGYFTQMGLLVLFFALGLLRTRMAFRVAQEQQKVLAEKNELLEQQAAVLSQFNQQLQVEKEERLQIGSSLAKAENRYQKLFNFAPVIYFITHFEGQNVYISDCNQLALEVLGYTRPEVIGRPIAQFYTAASVEKMHQSSADIQVGYAVKGEREFVTKDGRVLEFLLHTLVEVEGENYLSLAMYVDLSSYKQHQRDTENYTQQLRTLNQAQLALNHSLDVKVIFEKLLVYLKQLVPYDQANAGLLISGTRDMEFVMFQDYAEEIPLEKINQILRKSVFFGEILREKKALVIGNTYDTSAWIRVPKAENVVNWMGIPIMLRDEVIGLYTMSKATPHFFTQEHLHLAESLASSLAIALENARLHQTLKQEAGLLEQRVQKRTEELTHVNYQLTTLRQVGLELAGKLDLNELLQSILSEAVALLKAQAGILYVYQKSEAGEYLEPRAKLGEHLEHVPTRLAKGEGVSGRVWELGQPLILSQTYNGWPVPEPIRQAYASGISVPIFDQQHLLGVLSLLAGPAAYFTPADLDWMSLFAAQAAIALQNAYLHEQMHHYADELEQRVQNRTKELRVANEKLQDLDRLKNKFISDISHELRTPLTNLALYMDLLVKKPEKQEQYLKILRTQTRRLELLVNDIVQMSHLHRRREKTRLEWVNFNEVITTAVLPKFEAQFQQKGLNLAVKLTENCPKLWGDKQQLQELVEHLLNNALKYTAAGEVRLQTVWDEVAQKITLQIEDTGIGISAEDLPHIFNPFYRGQGASQSNIPGIGLGLTIVQEVVNIHQGSIEIVSRPGVEGGTAVVVQLPVGQEVVAIDQE